MQTTLAEPMSRALYQRALARFYELESESPSLNAHRRQSRLGGIIWSIKHNIAGNTAWGCRMNGRGLVQRRWKAYNKIKYDMTTFPFKLKPECREP